MQQHQRNYFLIFIILLLSLLILDYGQPDLFSFINEHILQAFYIVTAVLAIFVYFFDQSKTFLAYSTICFISYIALLIYSQNDLYVDGAYTVALLQIIMWPIFYITEYRQWRTELKVLFWMANAFHLVVIGIYFTEINYFNPYGFYLELYYFSTYIYIIYAANWNDLMKRLEQRYQDVKEISETQNLEFEKQLRAAQHVQSRSLPQGHEIKDIVMAIKYVPLWGVGGDFCSIIQPGTTFLKDSTKIEPLSHCGLIVGDVSGKGPAAALIMSDIIARTQMMGFGRIKPAETLGLLNEQLYTSEETYLPYFATACYLAFDTDTHEITIANAGHEPPLYFHAADHKVEALHIPGLMLGVSEGIYTYQERVIQYQKGDRLVLYTDGIMAMNASERSITELVMEYGHLTLENMLAKISELMTGSGLDHTHYDDYLILILEF